MLEAADIGVTLGGKEILRGISATFRPGALSMIIGPNGSGKTTLLRVLSGALRPQRGNVLYNARPSGPDDRVRMARFRGVLAQHADLSFPLTVEDVVMMGRYPHFAITPTRRDVAICTGALERAGIGSLHGRNYLTLSGGEKQMVHLARVLAQIWERPEEQCRVLLLDEPLTSLDINHQHHFLEIARSFVQEGDIVVAVLHDIHLVAQYADFILAVKHGTTLAEGATAGIIQPGVLSTLFDIQSEVVHTTRGIVPLFFTDPSKGGEGTASPTRR